MKEHVEKLYKLLPDLVKLENRLTDPGEKMVLRETVAQVLNLHDEVKTVICCKDCKHCHNSTPEDEAKGVYVCFLTGEYTGEYDYCSQAEATP